MSINLERADKAAQAYQAPERRVAGARQDRWLAELEQAMLAEGRKKEPERDQMALQTAVGQQAPAAVLPGEAEMQGSAAVPASEPVRTSAARTAPSANVQAASEVNSTQQTGTQKNTAPGLDVKTAGAAAPAPSATGTSSVPAANMAAMVMAQPAVGNAMSALQSLAAPARAAAADQSIAMDHAVNVQPVDAASALEMRLFAAPGQAGVLSQPQGADGEDAAAAQSSAARQEEPEPYAPRHMQLYKDEQGVQAWVRDAAIAPWQMAGLMHSMAAAVAVEGNRLRSLTVNGVSLDVDGAEGEQQAGFSSAFGTAQSDKVQNTSTKGMA